MTNANEALAIAEKLVAGIMANDVDTVQALYHPDAKIWHNTSDKLQSVEENMASIGVIHGLLAELNYEILRREATSSGFFQQHILRGIKRDGEAFAMHACVIIDIEDGKIVRLEEYLDSAAANFSSRKPAK